MSRVAGHGAARADHPVARNDDRNGVAPAGGADGAGGRADGRRDVAVGPERAVGNSRHGPADGLLEFRARRRQGEIEGFEVAPEIRQELLPGGPEKPGPVSAAGVQLVRRPPPVEGDDGAVFLEDGERADGALEG